MILIAFDLDDTLFDERDFLESAYHDIANRLSEITFPRLHPLEAFRAMTTGGFDRLLSILDAYECGERVDIPWLVGIYRNHRPGHLNLRPGAEDFLKCLSCRNDVVTGLITDGRELTQTAKIDALGVRRYFPEKNILISGITGFDKNSPQPFIEMMRRNPGMEKYVYIGDNPQKDFILPEGLGWATLCVADRGRNIHPQKLEILPKMPSLGVCRDMYEANRIITEFFPYWPTID